MATASSKPGIGTSLVSKHFQPNHCSHASRSAALHAKKELPPKSLHLWDQRRNFPMWQHQAPRPLSRQIDDSGGSHLSLGNSSNDPERATPPCRRGPGPGPRPQGPGPEAWARGPGGSRLKVRAPGPEPGAPIPMGACRPRIRKFWRGNEIHIATSLLHVVRDRLPL